MQRIVCAIARRRHDFHVCLFEPSCDVVYASCLSGRAFGWRTVFRMTLLHSDDLSEIRSTARFGIARLHSLRVAPGTIGASRRMRRGYDHLFDGKLLIVPECVDTSHFRPDAELYASTRAALGIRPQTPVALFCGAVVERKCTDTPVDASAHVTRRVSDALLLMVGPNHADGFAEPEYRQFAESIPRRIAAFDLDASVRFIGFTREVRPYYAAADHLVFPSGAQGWGNVPSEALACGVPAVVPPLEGIAEDRITDGHEGVIVRERDPELHAHHITTSLTNGGLSAHMRAAARARAIEHLDIARCADRYAGFLRRGAARQAAPHTSEQSIRRRTSGRCRRVEGAEHEVVSAISRFAPALARAVRRAVSVVAIGVLGVLIAHGTPRCELLPQDAALGQSRAEMAHEADTSAPGSLDTGGAHRAAHGSRLGPPGSSSWGGPEDPDPKPSSRTEVRESARDVSRYRHASIVESVHLGSSRRARRTRATAAVQVKSRRAFRASPDRGASRGGLECQ
jgi:glycosyltransferase involved in cell wall biosynthesis